MLVARLTFLPMLRHGGTLSPALRRCPPLLKPHRGYSTNGFRLGRTTRMILAGVAAVGLGAVCYHGQRKAMIWPPYVNERIHHTYAYFACSIGMAALSAVAVRRTPALMGLMTRGPWLFLATTFPALYGADILVGSISYEQSIPKHLAWILHAGVMGAVIAPITILGGPTMLWAAWYTAGIVGGLSAVAMCAQSEEFLLEGAGPVGMGLGLKIVYNIGSTFLPPHRGGIYRIAIFGGLVLFAGFLLFDTQLMIKRAETRDQNYDPIDACLNIYTDTLEIFKNLAMILAGPDERKK